MISSPVKYFCGVCVKEMVKITLAAILIELHGLCAAVLTYTLYYIPVEHVYIHTSIKVCGALRTQQRA